MAGIGSNKLTIMLGAVELAPEVSKVEITSAEAKSDFVSFASAALGGLREYALAFTGVQNLTSGSLWDETFSHAGDEAPVVVRPYGNLIATPAEPHIHGTVRITEPDGTWIGGSADASTSARFTFECEWIFTAKPTRVTA